MGRRNRAKEEWLSHDRLTSLLSYDPETGVFTWKIAPRRGRAPDTQAGAVHSHGYRLISIQRRVFLAAHLAWFYMTRTWPAHGIDHVNRVRDDDRLENLRPATQTQNNWNQKVSRKNTLGITGVSPDHERGKFFARLMKNGKHTITKRFDTIQEAVAARLAAERQHCGEFASAEAIGVA